MRRFTDTTYGYWAVFFSIVYDFHNERRDIIISIGSIIAFIILFVSFSMACWTGFDMDAILTILAIIFTILDAILVAIGFIFLQEDTYFYLSYKSTYKKCLSKNSDKPLKKYNRKIYLEIKPLTQKYMTLQTNVANLTAQIEKLQAVLNELEK